MFAKGSELPRRGVVDQRPSAADDGCVSEPDTQLSCHWNTRLPFTRKTAADPSGQQGLQISMSPYYGMPDFSPLDAPAGHAMLDVVSAADLLRYGFVCPPHSIFDDVKLVTFGFSPRQDMYDAPEFRFKFRESRRKGGHHATGEDWVGTYHRLLCDAVSNSCAGMDTPWLLQSGGKDSTTLAIATAEARPDATCITYLGGREENEVASARSVATSLGLRHEALTCDPARAYDRYLAAVPRMPLLTADFALLSYVDLVTAISTNGGDGVLDGLGSDSYFGTPVSRQQRTLSMLAMGVRLPSFVTTLPLVERNFRLCFGLSTLQMNPIERVFPGSRFTDTEVDEIFGREISQLSRARLAPFQAELASAASPDEWRAMAASIAGSAGAFAKGLYTTSAMSMRSAYPFCDYHLREWAHRQVPLDQLIDPISRTNKVLVRRHIATRFEKLPYVATKGSFRFDLCGLAQQRFEQVHDYASRTKDLLPGAVRWLERNRGRLDAKYHASKFYLLAIVLPWIESRTRSR